jgi:uncharacterized membrane protein YfcA
VTDVASYCLLSVAVFSGALVSSVAGFAFSAAAGAVLPHTLPPTEAAPLMMACSVAVQSVTLWALRHHMQWKGSLVLILGGVVGIPPAVYLLQNSNIMVFRMVFGVLVTAYAAYMLFRPTLRETPQQCQKRAGRIWRRTGRRIDRDAGGSSHNVVRSSWHAQEPAARSRTAVHLGHAVIRSGAYAVTP